VFSHLVEDTQIMRILLKFRAREIMQFSGVVFVILLAGCDISAPRPRMGGT